MAWLYQPLLSGGAQQQAGGGDTVLDAEAGSVAVSGQAVLFATRMICAVGSIAVTGYAVPNPGGVGGGNMVSGTVGGVVHSVASTATGEEL